MKTFDQLYTEITLCEKRAVVYNQLYEILEGFNSHINPADIVLLDKALENGEIKSSKDLAAIFDKWADIEYRTAQRLAKSI